MKSYLTRVRDKKIRKQWKQGLLCDKSVFHDTVNLLSKGNKTVKPIISTNFCYFTCIVWANIYLSDSVDQDQSARFVQSDLDLYCLRKVIDPGLSAYIYV